MIPSLAGRLQTRVVMMGTLGVVWSFVFAALIDAPLGTVFAILGIATVFGLLWELVYHWWSQRRWDQDFPSGLFLAAGLWEFVPVALAARALDVPLSTVAVHFFVLWVAVWLFLQGPMRIIEPRWRFRAGRLW